MKAFAAKIEQMDLEGLKVAKREMTKQRDLSHIQIETMRDLVGQLKAENERRTMLVLNIDTKTARAERGLAEVAEDKRKNASLEEENARLTKEREQIRD